jgi:DtxR family transcriptional regulator, Mn-dependent transcriptional regulator
MKMAIDPGWRAFEENEISHSAAHYLMAIAAFMRGNFEPKPADLARQLGISRSAVSVQLKSLANQGFLRLNEARRVVLTRSGADLVAQIVQKRKALKDFLEDVLGVAPKTAELDSCKIEHLISGETSDAIVRLTEFIRARDNKGGKFLKEFRTKRRAH